MITFKPTGADLDSLKQAAMNIQVANAALAKAKKQNESAKAVIEEWLKRERETQLEALPIGEMVFLEGVCLIEVGKQNKFDEKAFLADSPELHARFKKDFPVIRFKPALE